MISSIGFRLPFVDLQGSGEMVSRVTTDIEQLAAGLTMIFNQFFIGVLMILVSILAMLQSSSDDPLGLALEHLYPWSFHALSPRDPIISSKADRD